MKIVLGIILIVIWILFIFIWRLWARSQKDILSDINKGKTKLVDGKIEYDKKTMPLLFQISINKENIGFGFWFLFIIYGLDLIFLR